LTSAQGRRNDILTSEDSVFPLQIQGVSLRLPRGTGRSVFSRGPKDSFCGPTGFDAIPPLVHGREGARRECRPSPAFFRFRLRKGRFVSPTVLRRLIPAAQSLVGAGTSLSGLPQSGCFCPSVSVETSVSDGSAFSKLAALRARDNEISASEPGGIAASVSPHAPSSRTMR